MLVYGWLNFVLFYYTFDIILLFMPKYAGYVEVGWYEYVRLHILLVEPVVYTWIYFMWV